MNIVAGFPLVGGPGGEAPRKFLELRDFRAKKSDIFMSNLPPPVATVDAICKMKEGYMYKYHFLNF